MSVYVDYQEYGGRYATTIHESEKPTHSGLLGPDGKPLKYAQPPRLGFDLTPKKDRE